MTASVAESNTGNDNSNILNDSNSDQKILTMPNAVEDQGNTFNNVIFNNVIFNNGPNSENTFNNVTFKM